MAFDDTSRLPPAKPRTLMVALQKQIGDLQAQVDALERRVAELEAQKEKQRGR